ncbi:hypothetical protein SAMN05421823_104433 [Catalinimonas alkaloidigena]|uniref:Uncharacterized protein n=1 Tax=Catalinimonas alkaloidigena TaxID=1075417 RepID=A0A1G9HH31_9BACT|nr:hypothetical protein [Catalinimonas alkaloidigena]SDL12172.1 hypothetical protein SAMN05421823_104433 [Catalinimonas alkaloidigena]
MKTLLSTLALLLVVSFSTLAGPSGPQKDDDTTAEPTITFTQQVYDLDGNLQAQTQQVAQLPEKVDYLFSYAGVDYYILDEVPAYDNTLREVTLEP